MMNEDECNDFVDDLIENIGNLSSLYKYSNVLGRPRKWDKRLFKMIEIIRFGINEYLDDVLDQSLFRTIELIISLMTGSINSIRQVEASQLNNNLDKIKHKIVLFDGQQSRFIYKEKQNTKTIRIQGLAGTGKTELLLYKIKEIFLNQPDKKIGFTCKNNVLANELKNRVPKFFNALEVSKQIMWDDKMFVFPSWGSRNNYNSGLYRYLCHVYGATFYMPTQIVNFKECCQLLLDHIKSIPTKEYAFDYLFVDESQDFQSKFYQLCELVTKEKVYYAGDIF